MRRTRVKSHFSENFGAGNDLLRFMSKTVDIDADNLHNRFRRMMGIRRTNEEGGTVVNSRTLALSLMLGVGLAAPAHALQCVPYARQVSGIELQGDAWRWWSAAQGIYDRGTTPQVGAVLVFRQTAHMRHGHVAVVRQVLNRREIRIDHANWGNGQRGGRGGVSQNVAVLDVSLNNDWSQVRVWHAPSGGYGNRANPSYGFIYSRGHQHPHRNDSIVEASLTSVMPQAAPTVTAMSLPDSTSAMALDSQHITLTPPPPSSSRHQSSAAHLNARVLAGLQLETHHTIQPAEARKTPAQHTRAAQAVKKTGGKIIRVNRTIPKPMVKPATKPTPVSAKIASAKK